MENSICKIVYFDEDSVTDYVQIVAGGELENTTELLKSKEALSDENCMDYLFGPDRNLIKYQFEY